MLQATQYPMPLQIQISKPRYYYLEGFCLYYLILIGSPEGPQTMYIWTTRQISNLNMLAGFHKPTGSTKDKSCHRFFQNLVTMTQKSQTPFRSHWWQLDQCVWPWKCFSPQSNRKTARCGKIINQIFWDITSKRFSIPCPQYSLWLNWLLEKQSQWTREKRHIWLSE